MAALLLVALFAVLINPSDSCFATPATTTPTTTTPATNTTPCRSCAANLITITQVGIGAKPMDVDVIDRTTAACATRTFTCLGPVAGNPNIGINNGFGFIQDADDGNVDGSVMFTVTCNAAGTAWVNTGIDVTQVECSLA